MPEILHEKLEDEGKAPSSESPVADVTTSFDNSVLDHNLVRKIDLR